MRIRKICNIFSIITGFYLLIQAVWLLAIPVSLGTSGTNFILLLSNFIVGVLGIYLGNKDHSRQYNLVIGLLHLSISFLWYLNIANEMIIKLLNMNSMIATLHLIFGITGLLLGIVTPKRKHSYNAILLY
jgi:hypothetical protein